MSEEKSHAERHPKDVPPPSGYLKLRIDNGDSKDRVYALIPSGHGEKQRIENFRRTGRLHGRLPALVHSGEAQP